MTIEERDLIIKVSETVYKLDNSGREKFLLMCDAFALGVEAGRKCGGIRPENLAAVMIGAAGAETAPQEVKP